MAEKRSSRSYWRGGPDCSMPRGLTARDVLNYEIEELGNDPSEYEVVPGADLDIASERLRWVTELESDAAEYGEPWEFGVPEHEVIARDRFGGLLIALPAGWR